MGLTFRKYLEEFPSDAISTSQPAEQRFRPRLDPFLTQRTPVEDPVAAAHAKGFESGSAIARAAFDFELANVRTEHQRQIEQLRSSFAKDIANRLAELLKQELRQQHDLLADQVAVILVPVLRHCMTKAAVHELAHSLSSMVQDTDALVIEIAGPEETIGQVWQSFCETIKADSIGKLPEVRFTTNNDADVSISVNESIIESRLNTWIAKVSEATALCQTGKTHLPSRS